MTFYFYYLLCYVFVDLRIQTLPNDFYLSLYVSVTYKGNIRYIKVFNPVTFLCAHVKAKRLQFQLMWLVTSFIAIVCLLYLGLLNGDFL